MKRIACLVLVVVLLMSLVACGHTHAFGQWSTVSDATCTKEGAKERVCECGEKETETIAATGHSFTAATAFAPKTCTACGETEGEALATLITMGGEVEAEDHSFTVESATFTGKLKEKRGSVTYTYGGGDYVYAIKLNFTNLGTEAMDGWNSDRLVDMQATYDDKYTYDGTAWIPGNDIVPLSTGNVYVLFEIPESVETGSEPLTAKFVVDGNEFNIDCRANG